jgi:hypothetical protein
MFTNPTAPARSAIRQSMQGEGLDQVSVSVHKQARGMVSRYIGQMSSHSI